MYIIGLDDGSNVGLFNNEDEALRCFVQFVAENGVEPYRSTATGLNLMHDELVNVFEQPKATVEPGPVRKRQDEDKPSIWTRMARNLLKETDCFIWMPAWLSGVQVYPANGSSPLELGEAILGDLTNHLTRPADYLKGPQRPLIDFDQPTIDVQAGTIHDPVTGNEM